MKIVIIIGLLWLRNLFPNFLEFGIILWCLQCFIQHQMPFKQLPVAARYQSSYVVVHSSVQQRGRCDLQVQPGQLDQGVQDHLLRRNPLERHRAHLSDPTAARFPADLQLPGASPGQERYHLPQKFWVRCLHMRERDVTNSGFSNSTMSVDRAMNSEPLVCASTHALFSQHNNLLWESSFGIYFHPLEWKLSAMHMWQKVRHLFRRTLLLWYMLTLNITPTLTLTLILILILTLPWTKNPIITLTLTLCCLRYYYRGNCRRSKCRITIRND